MNQLAKAFPKSLFRSHIIYSKVIGPVNGQVFLRLINTSNKDGPKSSGGHDDEHHERHLPASDPREMRRPDIIVGHGIGKAPPGPKTVEDFKNWKANKNWISAGYDFVDQRSDRYWNNMSYFCMVCIWFMGLGWLFMYYPDFKLEAWASREAYLEMARRKKLGMKPYVSKDYVDPDRITLPTEEELEGYEIIV